MIQLRDNQRRAIDELYDWFRANKTGNPIVDASVGAGKSIMLGQLCREVATSFSRAGRVLQITPSKELCEQNLGKLQAVAPDLRINVVSASLNKKEVWQDTDVTIGTIGTLYNAGAGLGRYDLILIDECFVAGTLIETESGQKPIEEIVKGDVVLNALGCGAVIETSTRQTNTLIELRLSNGRTITTTPNHRFFTSEGWVKAGSLVVGSITFSREAVRMLWNGVSSVEKSEGGWKGKRTGGEVVHAAGFLLNILRMEEEKSDELGEFKEENVLNTQEDESPANQPRGERETAVFGTACASARAWGRMGSGVSNCDKDAKEQRIPDVLQAGHSKQRNEGRNRGRRAKSLRLQEGSGRKEIRVPWAVRVESVARIERESPAPVFNIHVSGHPSYFANGVLVHNCHLVNRNDTGMYRELVKTLSVINPAIRIIGWTGTPYRGNGIFLTDGDDRLFTDIATRITMRQLLDEGFLSPLVNAESRITITSDGLATDSTGDYKIQEVAHRIDQEGITEQIADEICRLGADRKRWIVYCVTVQHAEHMAMALWNRGVTVDVVHAKTGAKERREILEAFRAGETKCLVNVACLTTGLDVPEIDLLALARNTKSPVLYTQIGGRGMRISPGKDNCLWLDFTDTTAKMGPIDMIRGRPSPNQSRLQGQRPYKLCPMCGASSATGAATCHACGYAFPPSVSSVYTATSHAPVLSDGTVAGVETETVPVTSVTCLVKTAKSGAQYLRVIFWSDMASYSKNLMIGHPTMGRKAMTEWLSLIDTRALPSTCEEAHKLILSGMINFRHVRSIDVDMRSQYKDIKSINFV